MKITNNIKKYLVDKGLFEGIDEMLFLLLVNTYTFYLEAHKIVKEEGAVATTLDYHGREKKITSIAFSNMMALQKLLISILGALYCTPKSRKELNNLDDSEDPIEKLLKDLDKIN